MSSSLSGLSASMFYPPDTDSDEDYEDSNSTGTIPSTQSSQSSKNRKKWKTNITSKPTEHVNKSHTSYFFRINEDNFTIVYYKICEHNLSGTRQKPYPYTR